MSQFTADFRHLDPATRDYLASVARSKGRGAPGVFLSNSGGWPFLSLFAGSLILFFGLLYTLGFPKSPWASAMLLTAATLLGGWLVLYPFRRWLGGGLGHFSYFDTHHVYRVQGREVSVANIAAMKALDPTENFNNGTYQSTTLLFRLPGRAFSIPVTGRRKAEFVCTYYEKLEVLESDGTTAKLSPPEHGAMAKHLANGGTWPVDSGLIDLTIRELPEEATATRTTQRMMLRYLAILASAAAIYFLGWALLVPVQDDMAFTEAAKHGVQGYRDYLLDEHNTLHRDEAKAKIAEFYKHPIAIANTCADPVERKAWTELLTDLSEFDGFPVVSIAVEENAAMKTAEVTDREKTMRTWLADSLGSLYGPNYIAFVAPPEGVKPQVEMKYSFLPGEQKITWQITFRTTLTAEPTTGPGHAASNIGATMVFFPPEPFKTQFFVQTFQAAPPPMHAEPAVVGSDNGD